jgi:hypothetical protein
MEKINYLEIFKKAWETTWENKYLWWFGLFLSLGVGGMGFRFPLGGNTSSKNQWNNQEILTTFRNFFNEHMVGVIFGIAVVAVLIIASVILANISRSGLIKSIYFLEKRKPNNFKVGFQQGKKYFWKVIGISVVLNILMIFLMIIIFAPIIFLFYLKAFWLGAAAVFFGIALVVPLLILKIFMQEYAYIYVVLSDLKIYMAMENAYKLFRKNFLCSIITALLFIPVSLIMFAIIFAVFVIVGIIFAIMGIILYLLLGNIGVIVALAIGLVIFFAAILLIGSIYQVFRQAVWIMVFMEIASVKNKDNAEEKVAETEIIAEKLPSAGEAI